MSIVVHCRCGQSFAAPAQYAGQTLPCPICQAPLAVPAVSRGIATGIPQPTGGAAFSQPAAATPNVANWICRFPNGQQLGPGTYEQLADALRGGHIPPGSMVSQAGGNWQSVQAVFGAGNAIYGSPGMPLGGGMPPAKSVSLQPWLGIGLACSVVVLILGVAYFWLISRPQPVAQPPQEQPGQNQPQQNLAPQGNNPQPLGQGSVAPPQGVATPLPGGNRPVVNRPNMVPGGNSSGPKGNSAGFDPASLPDYVYTPPKLEKLTNSPVFLGKNCVSSLSSSGPFVLVKQSSNELWVDQKERQFPFRKIDLRTGKVVWTKYLAENHDLLGISSDGETWGAKINPSRGNVDFRQTNGQENTAIWRAEQLPRNMALPRGEFLFWSGNFLGISESYSVLTVFNVSSNNTSSNQAWQKSADKLQLSACGKYVVGFVEPYVVFYDLATGQPKMKAAVEGIRGGDIVFSENGRYLASNNARGGSVLQYIHSQVLVWDFQAKKKILDLPISEQSGSVSWLGADYLVTKGKQSSLIGLREQRVLAQIDLKQVPPMMQRGSAITYPLRDDKVWIRQTDTRGNDFLVPHTIPNPQALSQLPTQPEKQHSLTFSNTEPIRIDYQFQAQGPKKSMDRVKTALEGKWRSSGYTLADNATRVVRVTVTDVPTNRPDIPYEEVIERPDPRRPGRKITERKGIIMVPNRDLKLSIELYSDGNLVRALDPVVRNTDYVNSTAPVSVFTTLTADHFLDERWNQLSEHFGPFPFDPEYRNDAELPLLNVELAALTVTDEQIPAFFQEEQAASEVSRKEFQKYAIQGSGFGTNYIDLPLTAEPRAWQPMNDPRPTEANTTPLVPKPISLGPEQVSDIRFASAEVGHAAVLVTEGIRTGVQRWDLRKKKKLSGTEIPPQSKLFDFRPDGLVYATANRAIAKEVLVWSAVEGEDKHVTTVELPPNTSVRNATFLGKKQLAIVAHNQIYWYSLPGGELLRKQPFNANELCLSNSRAYFLDWNAAKCCLLLHDSQEGKLLGQFEPLVSVLDPDRFSADRISAADFHPDGKHVAACVGQLGVWDLTNGKLVRRFNEPCTNVRWTGPKYLLLNKSKLFDVELGRVVWNYQASFAEDSPDGKGWFWGFDRKRTTQLASLFLPTETVFSSLKPRLEKLEPVLSKGDGLNTELTFDASVDMDSQASLTAALQAGIAAAMKSKNLQDNPAASKTMKIKVLQLQRGYRTHTYRFQKDKKTWTLPEQQLQLKVTVEDGTQQLLTRELVVSLPQMAYQFRPEHPKPISDLLDQFCKFTGSEFQAFIENQIVNATSQSWKGSGTSHVDLEGERIVR